MISDAFVYRLDETDYLVDCHYQLLDQIIRHCQKYRLRMKVDIRDVSDKFDVWAAWGDFGQLDLPQTCVVRCNDSRKPDFGQRFVLPKANGDALRRLFSK